MEWKQVQTDEDIQELLKAYSGFHDACIASAQYVSGTRVADDGTMWFKGGEDYRLLVLFHSQWEPHYLELYFEGVRRFRLIGQQDNYLNDIYEAFIKFYDEILPWEYTASPRVIVWSDGEFDPESVRDRIETGTWKRKYYGSPDAGGRRITKRERFCGLSLFNTWLFNVVSVFLFMYF